MRILEYKNEKVSQCPYCETKVAYIKDDIHWKNEDGDSVDTVKGFLKWVKSSKDIINQLTGEQFKILQKHPDWVCYSGATERYLICPCCKKHIELPAENAII